MHRCRSAGLERWCRGCRGVQVQGAGGRVKGAGCRAGAEVGMFRDREVWRWRGGADVERCRVQGAECRVQGVDRCRNADVQMCRCCADLQMCGCAEVQRCRGAEMQRWCRGGEVEVQKWCRGDVEVILRSRGTEVQGCICAEV